MNKEVIFPILNKSNIFLFVEVLYEISLDHNISHILITKKLTLIESFLTKYHLEYGDLEVMIQPDKLLLANIESQPSFIFDHLRVDEDELDRFIEKQTFEQKTKHIVGLNEKLLESNKQVRKLIEDKNYLINFLAHEVRNPLNALMNYAELMVSSPELLEDVDLGEVIQDLTSDMKHIVDDVLEFSKLEASKIKVSKSNINVDKFSKLMASQTAQLVKNNNLDFKFINNLDSHKFIQADKQRLKQILNNFVSNALKFTETGYIIFEVAPINDDKIIFTIQDTGEGISEEFKQSIFQEFSQATHIAKKGIGTGLGLNICKKLANLMGAEIVFESSKGVGSSFSVVVPLLDKTSIDDDRHHSVISEKVESHQQVIKH